MNMDECFSIALKNNLQKSVPTCYIGNIYFLVYVTQMTYDFNSFSVEKKRLIICL